MKLLFELYTSPFGLPISPLYEYLILAGIGLIAFWIAYGLAGLYGSSSGERKVLHWVIRFFVFIALWAITRVGIWIYNNQKLTFIIACIVVGVLILFGIIKKIVSFAKDKKRGE
ncbi:MAG: hypothetical protein K5654_07040 [Lachnospiraceae bacterium]|nr:hypothetical protein [Lachnospiraceae bacterium]